MNPILKPLAAAGLALSLGISVTPALAAQEKSPEEMAAEGVGRILEAMKIFIDSLPMYAAPEILPNGDIIIRRLNPPSEDEKVSPDGSKDIKT